MEQEDRNRLRRIFKYLARELRRITMKEIEKLRGNRSLWDRLASEGRFGLLTTLHYVEKGEAGFGTVVVPAEGFSDSDVTHNQVLDWLRARGVNVFNPSLEVTWLERALHGSGEESCGM